VDKIHIFVFLALFSFLASWGLYAQSEEKDLEKQIEALETRLERIESKQDELLAQDKKILAELDRIRVWVHRK
jgi:hypothetical protein